METPPERHSFTHHFFDLGHGGGRAAALGLVKGMVIGHWTRPLPCCPAPLLPFGPAVLLLLSASRKMTRFHSDGKKLLQKVEKAEV